MLKINKKRFSKKFAHNGIELWFATLLSLNFDFGRDEQYNNAD